MRTSRFFLALLGFTVINVLAQCCLSSSLCSKARILDIDTIRAQDSEIRQQGTWTWWVTRQYLIEPQPPDLVLMGSSQMASALFTSDAKLLARDLDCVKYRGAATLERELQNRLDCEPRIFDYAMGGAMVSDHFMISNVIFKKQNKPKLVVLGISPRDFMDNTLSSPGVTEQFRFFSPYMDLSSLSSIAFADLFDQLGWFADRYIPLKSIHKQLNLLACYKRNEYAMPGYTYTKVAQKQLLQAISGGTGEVKPGEWIIPHSASFGFIDNTGEYLRRYKDPTPPVYRAEQEFFKRLLAVLTDRDIKVLVVMMPSLLPNRSLLPNEFWAEYKKNIWGVCAEYKSPVLDLSDSSEFTVNDYIDTVHLNASGGQKLFRAIADTLCNDAHLAASLMRRGRANPSLLGAKTFKEENTQL